MTWSLKNMIDKIIGYDNILKKNGLKNSEMMLSLGVLLMVMVTEPLLK